MNGEAKRVFLQSIVDKAKARLEGWHSKLLSMAGRVQLIKSVIYPMLLHSFMVYAWPISFIKQVALWVRNFIWSGNIAARKLVTVSWNKLCSPFDEGGLGLRRLREINRAANFKLCWDLLSNDCEWNSLKESSERMV